MSINPTQLQTPAQTKLLNRAPIAIYMDRNASIRTILDVYSLLFSNMKTLRHVHQLQRSPIASLDLREFEGVSVYVYVFVIGPNSSTASFLFLLMPVAPV